ncbi:hypothetical protein [Micromonospora sp. LH3U1]|uniref:hypothetical protein n=1 Tax=Micromonospora sp. LH3U1 TaxID=3018339 RepID=UPI00234A52EF|nr:hypothetical protein [Micromonospora sp. LH3U1]WCN83187.1 hypothetical protein PCA76_09110 [Micromonospora sp. LH3U1]
MHSIFTGRLLLPLLSPLRRTAAVTLGDGTPVAVLRRKFVSKRHQFDVLDAGATTLLATGAATSFANDHHQLVGPRSEVILEYDAEPFPNHEGHSRTRDTTPGRKPSWDA